MVFWACVRSHASKGSGPRQKQLDRLQAHLGRQGLSYSPHLALRHRLNAASTSMGIAGTAATSVQSKMIEDRKAEGNMSMKELVQRESTFPNEQFVRNGQCTLCQKTADEWHLSSCAHRLRAEEHVIGTEMSGPAASARRFSVESRGYGGGCPKPLNKRNMYEYWGAGIESLVQAAQKRILERPVIFEKKVILDSSKIKAYELCIVSYRGTGKYGNGDDDDEHRMQLHPWVNVPDDEHSLEPQPLPPPGCSWWPVVKLHPQDAVVEEVRQHRGWAANAYSPIVCFYQLMSTPPAAWAFWH